MTEEAPSAPASDAAAAPEPPFDSDPVVHAVGVGPGPDFPTGRARALLDAADVVVGFETVVDVVRDLTDADTLTCGYADEMATLATFAERVAAGERGVAVLMGDPNVSGYQFLGKVEHVLDRQVRVVPGVSSVQVAASRARTPIESSTVATLHRRGDLDASLDRLAADAGQRHLIVLPRPYDWMPERLAAFLVDQGASPDLTALVYEHLTHEAESRTATTLGALSGAASPDEPQSQDETAFSDLSVFVVRAPSPPPYAPRGES